MTKAGRRIGAVASTLAGTVGAGTALSLGGLLPTLLLLAAAGMAALTLFVPDTVTLFGISALYMNLPGIAVNLYLNDFDNTLPQATTTLGGRQVVIGTLFGALYTYLTADSIVRRGAKKETHGFSEAEARLPTISVVCPALTTALSATPLEWVA